MQGFIYFFIVCAMSLATDVSVYNFDDYYFAPPGTEFETDFSIPWKFSFTSNDRLYMAINLFNIPPSVTMIKVASESDLKTVILRVPIGEHVLMVYLYHPLSGAEAIINLIFYTTNSFCTSIKVAEGRLLSTLRHEETKKEYTHDNICFKGEKQPCVLLVNLKDLTCKVTVMQTRQKPEPQVTTAKPFTSLENNKNTYKPYGPISHAILVLTTPTSKITAPVTGPPIATRTNENVNTITPLTDLLNNNTVFGFNVSSSSHDNNMTTSTNSFANNTENNDQQQPPQSKVLIRVYVITSTIAMCIIILVSYIGVKKYCHRKMHPVETREVNTYATANEVVYADLSLMHGDSQPPRREEESPYAEIIGVLKPH